MSRKHRDELIKEVTNDLLTSKFTSELGQKAKVERSAINSEHMENLREVVRDIGRNLLEIGAAPQGMTYCGSLTVHIYKSETLKMAAFVSLSAHDKLTFDLADAGLRELTGTTLESYGRSRRKLRSKF